MLDGKSFAVLKDGVSVQATHIQPSTASVVDKKQGFLAVTVSFIEPLADDGLGQVQLVDRGKDRFRDVIEAEVRVKCLPKFFDPHRGLWSGVVSESYLRGRFTWSEEYGFFNLFLWTFDLRYGIIYYPGYLLVGNKDVESGSIWL